MILENMIGVGYRIYRSEKYIFCSTFMIYYNVESLTNREGLERTI